MGISHEQRERRRERIGASDAAAILGLDRFRDGLSVYLEKVGSLGEQKENEAIALGNDHEEGLIRFAERTIPERLGPLCKGVTIQRDVEVRPEDTVLSCNLDGYFEWDGKSYGVEAKTTSFVEDWGEEGKDEVPGRVTIQCQVQCHVANLDGVFVPVLMPLHGRLAQRLFYVERCDELIDEIVPKLNQWWVRHVEAKEPPEATEKALEAIKRIERKGSKVAVLPEKLYNELEVTKQEIRKLEKVKSEIEAKLLSQLGDAEVGEIEGTDLELTYFKQSRTSYGVGAKYSEDKCPYCAVGKSTSEFRVARSRKVKLLSGPK